MNTTARPLTYQKIADTIATLPSPVLPFHIYYTPLATKEETVTRTWKERLFTLPWQPWQRDKLQTQPAIYKINLPLPGLPVPTFPRHQIVTFIAHPAFKDAIETALKSQSSKETRQCGANLQHTH